MGLCDHGIHLIDTFLWLMNSRTTGVWGRGNVSGEGQQPEYIRLAYANGAIGQLLYEDGTFTTTLPHEGTFAWGAGYTVGDSSHQDSPSGIWQADPLCIHVHGSLGSLRIIYYANAVFLRTRNGIQQVRVVDKPFPANCALQLGAFVEAIRTGAATPVPGEVGLDAVRALVGVYAQSGKPITTSL
jgi:predicted dehydrogenase